jgi:hypothetical protein
MRESNTMPQPNDPKPTQREPATRRLSPLQKLVGLSMWAPGVAWLTTVMGTLMVAQRFFPPDEIEWLTRIYTRGQLRVLGTRVEYVVHPDVDPKRQYMFVQNHVNMIDHCTVYAATPHFKQGVELASHFDVPFYGWFMRQRGTVAVYRDRPLREAQQSRWSSARGRQRPLHPRVSGRHAHGHRPGGPVPQRFVPHRTSACPPHRAGERYRDVRSDA